MGRVRPPHRKTHGPVASVTCGPCATSSFTQCDRGGDRRVL